ncbi:Teichoic acid biosynthesis protein C (Precursor) [Streptomyces sp. NPDC090106]|uniref:phage baseplate protein n=1 Tax=Streptomyces sp. NPDC090106 TaxID=3365946 RepID=UPI003813FF88
MTPRVDLAVAAVRRVAQKRLHEVTVLQSFAFDETHERLYALQVRRGGGEEGHLCLNQLTLTGELLGHMHLRGFGHGVSMGVQNAADGTVWIWTEADAHGGYGQGVTRFRFADGATRTGADVALRKPIPGSLNNQPSVCMASSRIAVRYRLKGVPRYRVWDLDAFVARSYGDPLADIAQPAAHPDPKIPFQGYALHGDHIYQLAGTAYDSTANPAAKGGNAHVSCVDVTTGELLQRTRTEAGRRLAFREPEGVAVRHRAGQGVYLGFASGEAGARRFSLFAKPQRQS